MGLSDSDADASEEPERHSFRWGILSTARTAAKRTLPAMLRLGHELVAITGRSSEKVQQFAETFAIPRTYNDAQSLLADPDIDGIYIPLPSSLHALWVVRALNARKHVFCEKPLALEPREIEDVLAAADANRCLVEENFSYHLAPAYRALQKLRKAGSPLEIQAIAIRFSFRAVEEHGIRFRRSLGGGSFLDLGCYGTDFVHRLLGEAMELLGVSAEPLPEAVAGSTLEADTPVDGRCEVLARTRSGVRVAISTSFLHNFAQTVFIHTADGRAISLPQAFRIERTESRLHWDDGKHGNGERVFKRFDADQAIIASFSSRARKHQTISVEARARWRRNAAFLAQVEEALRLKLGG